MTDQQHDTEEKPEEAAPPPRAQRWLRLLLLTLGPILALAIGAWFYVIGGRYSETDNAYVKADTVSVSAEIAGPVAEVLVRENERVSRGQALFRIEDDKYQAALARHRARLQGALAFIDSMRSSYRQKQEELDLARSEADYAERQFKRQSRLAEQNLSAESNLDEARHDADTARRRIAITRQALDQLRVRLGGEVDAATETHPLFRQAKAEYDEARLNLEHTVVYAPFDGVAHQTPESGQYVHAGKPVMAVVADRDMWIEANFKETELTHVRPGQPVTIHVDTYPGWQWQSKVDSLSQASGAEFSVLPPQNATGNWVKVVQRIPVRIAIPDQPDAPQLRVGMSASVSIDTGYQRPLPHFVRTLLDWLGGSFAIAAGRE